MATRIKLSNMEQQILDRVFLSPDGFEPVEDLLSAIGGDRNLFVDALEMLEGAGYLAVANVGGSVIVACENPVRNLAGSAPTLTTNRVGHC